MPRVTKERTKYHAPKAVAAPKPTPDVGNIVSAPVSLTVNNSTNTEKDVTQLKSKRAKRADRHQKWMDKIGAAQTKQKLEQRQQGRQTNPSALIRGMSGMKTSLKEVQAELIAQHLLSLNSKGPTTNRPATSNNASHLPKSRKARDKAAIKEEKRFGQILLHPAFQANPLATIRQHLANTLPQQQQTTEPVAKK
ncbi:hypothetical protein GGI09_002168 [Coemansia sp. S100]|nr:hypothetical protein LPJ71_001169 [Coemansia sp. S17]KAJ2100649.1 hypothetical protein GGI09_002168 [Coemansia sp. S100]KAJ2106733.1 hypothetical protein GGI16_001816 [Coemansia sp. S142-1]